MKAEEMIQALLDEMVKKLALEVVKRQLDEETDPDRLEDCEVCQVLIKNMLGSGNRDYSVRMRMHKPIIGIGAPVHLFLAEAASLLGAEAILPEHADVANAIGAVTSQVKVRRQVKIRPSQAGGFVIEGLPGAKRFLDFEEAMTQAEEGLTRTGSGTRSRIRDERDLGGNRCGRPHPHDGEREPDLPASHPLGRADRRAESHCPRN